MNGTERYIATNLGSVLRFRGIKQSWLYAHVNVSRSMMSRIVSRSRSVDADLAERIATVLGSPVESIFTIHERNVGNRSRTTEAA